MFEEIEAEWTKALLSKGHSLYLDDGTVDFLAYDDYDQFCNGPICRTCHEVWCMHCNKPEDVEVCEPE